VIRYALTRLALLLLGLFVASALIFLTLRVLPGDVAQLIAGMNSSPEQVAAIRSASGSTAPARAVPRVDRRGPPRRPRSSLLTGARSRRTRAEGQVTIPLGLMAMTIAILIALPFGVISAIRRGHADGTRSRSARRPSPPCRSSGRA
jgi:peptide/nickel transport system permease protein